jgi:hypothetical protein
MICPKWHVGQVGQGAKEPYGGIFLMKFPHQKNRDFL